MSNADVLVMSLVSLLTFIESVIIHVSVHVQILSSHKGEFCFRMLIGSIVRVITKERQAHV